MDLAADDRLGQHEMALRSNRDPRPAKPVGPILSYASTSPSSVISRFQATTMTFPMHAAQFENIGKIGIELDRQKQNRQLRVRSYGCEAAS